MRPLELKVPPVALAAIFAAAMFGLSRLAPSAHVVVPGSQAIAVALATCGAAVALVQQGVEHGGGELAAFPIERAQLHRFIGRTGGKRGRGKQQANQQQQQAAHEKPFRRHGADKRSVTQNAV